MKYWWRHLKRQPNRLVAGGFAAAILLAAILLALPVSASGERIPLIDGLFKNTSTSLGAGLSVTNVSDHAGGARDSKMCEDGAATSHASDGSGTSHAVTG